MKHSDRCSRCGQRHGFPHHPFGQCAEQSPLTDAQQIAIQAFELWQKDWKTPYHSQEDLLWQAFRAGYESGLVVATRDPDAAELGWPIGA